jgi:hypothetical protein
MTDDELEALEAEVTALERRAAEVERMATMLTPEALAAWARSMAEIERRSASMAESQWGGRAGASQGSLDGAPARPT